MRAAIRCGLLIVALSASARPVLAESENDQWERALANAQTLIQARTSEVRDLRKKTDELVESLNKLAQTKVLKVTPEFKQEIARKRLYYYTQLGRLNAGVVELEQTLPKKVAPIAQQKVLNLLTVLRGELRATVIALNHVARSLKDL